MGDLGTVFGTTFGSGLLANGGGPPDDFLAAGGGATRGAAFGLAMAAFAGAFGRAGGATALGAATARAGDLPGRAAALEEDATFAAGLGLAAVGRAPAFAAGGAMRRAAETCLAFAAGRTGLPNFAGTGFAGPKDFLRAGFPDGLARAGAFIPDQSPATAVAPATDR